MADNERIARRAVEIAEELRAALPRNTDFSDGWQQRYLDRQNERFEQALEMARAEAASAAQELGWKTPELTEAEWREASSTVASRAPDILGLDEQDLPTNGVQAPHQPQQENNDGC